MWLTLICAIMLMTICWDLYPIRHVVESGGTCSLQWRQNERDGVSNSQPNDCLLNCLFRRGSKKTSKLRVTDLCAGNSPVTGEFPAQRASNAENVSIWWRHHVRLIKSLQITWRAGTCKFHLCVPDKWVTTIEFRGIVTNNIADRITCPIVYSSFLAHLSAWSGCTACRHQATPS